MAPPPRRAASPSGELTGATLRGTAWVGASLFGGKLVFFACTLLLARLLSEDDFGVAAYAITLVTMLDSVPGLGLAPALIHHRDDPETLDTGFWLGVATGVLVFALVWTLAPLTAWFFGDDRAVPVTRMLALVFPLEALRNVHATLLRKRLAFRRRFVPDMVQSSTKGAVAIGLALLGFDYWSLIWGTIAATALGIPVYWIASGWRPGLRVSTAAVRRLLPFGAHVMSIDLLGAFVRNVDYLLVGRYLGAATLGVYTLAFRIPDLLVRNLCLTLGQVLLPVYAHVREDQRAIDSTFLASLGYVTALTAPIAIGLALVAEPLVVTALGERWRDVALVLPSICIYALLISFTFNLGDLYKALGRPDVLTRLSLLRAFAAFPALWFGASVVGSAAAVGWAQAGVAALSVVANFWVASALFHLPVGQALARTLPIAGACACMSVAVLALRPYVAGSADAVQLLIFALVGAIVYAAALRALAREFWDDGQRALVQALWHRRLKTGGGRVMDRIAYLVPRFPKLSETFVADEMETLERRGATIELYALLAGRDSPSAVGARSSAIVASAPRALAAQLYWLVHEPRELLRIWRSALSRHRSSPRRFAQALLGVGAAGEFALRMRRSRVAHVHAHFATHSALAAWAIRRLTGIPYSFTVHADDIFIRRPMLEEKVGESAFVVAISEFNRRFLVEQLGEAASSRIRVIHCGVDPRAFAPLPPAKTDAPFTILCVGRLEPKKGQHHLIEACRRLAERGIAFRCLLVGEGRERAALERARSALGLGDRVELLGACSRERIRELMAEAHVFALPSVVAVDGRAEGIPVALMEAMAMQRPVVSVRISGIPELIEDGRSGLLVEPGDPSALADALARIHGDPRGAAQMAREAVRAVRERFDLDDSARRLLALIREHHPTRPASLAPGFGSANEIGGMAG